MLYITEFDTYGVLRQYAKDPDNPKNILALKSLKHRAISQMRWRVFCCYRSTIDNADNLMQFQLGMSTEKAVVHTKTMANMNAEELMDVWKRAVEQVGLTVDPEALAKAQQQ